MKRIGHRLDKSKNLEKGAELALEDRMYIHNFIGTLPQNPTEEDIDTLLSPTLASSLINEMLTSTASRGLSRTSDEILNLPVIFLVAYEGELSDELSATINTMLASFIGKVNSIMEGNLYNSPYIEGRWQAPNTIEEGFTTNCRFILADRIPKNSIHPFIQTKNPNTGVFIGEEYTSTITYEELEVLKLNWEKDPKEESTTAYMEGLNNYYFFLTGTPGLVYFSYNESLMYSSTGLSVLHKIAALQGRNVEGLSSGVFYSTLGVTVPLAKIFQSSPSVVVSTAIGTSPSSTVGVAPLFGALVSEYPSASFALSSITNIDKNESFNQDDELVFPFLHEFFHTIGFSHRQSHTTFLNTVDGSTSTLSIGGSKISFTSMTPLFSHGFTPPFVYNDLGDSFFDLPADEKTFVELVINVLLPELTENFQRSSLALVKSTVFNGSDFLHATRLVLDSTGNSAGTVQHAYNLIYKLPTFWGGSYTTNTDGSKSMLINPADLEGVRLGPNITVRNAVCVPTIDSVGNIVPSNTLNFGFWAGLDWYNPEYPAFPNNTKVEEMFSPETCPCLYEEQSYTSYSGPIHEDAIEELKTFTIFNSEGEFTGDEGFVALRESYNKGVSPYNQLPYNLLHTILADNHVSAVDIFGKYSTTDVESNLFGSYVPPTWVRHTGATSKYYAPPEGNDFTFIPQFPVYIGFIPTADIPIHFTPVVTFGDAEEESAAIAAGKSKLNDKSALSLGGYNFEPLINKYLRLGSTDISSVYYNPFKITASNLVPFSANFATGIGTEDDVYLKDIFIRKSPYVTYEDFPYTLYGPVNQNTFANLMYYDSKYTDTVLPSAGTIDRLNTLTTLEHSHNSIKQIVDFGEEIFNLPLPHTPENTLQEYINTSLEFVASYDVSAYKEGCTDPSALNYDSEATIDDGSCVAIVEGCTNPLAINYNPLANVNIGNCIGAGENYAVNIYYECGDPAACNASNNNLLGGIHASLSSVIVYDDFILTASQLSLLETYRVDCEENPINTEFNAYGGGCIYIRDNSLCVYPTILQGNCTLAESSVGETTQEYLDSIGDDLATIECPEIPSEARRGSRNNNSTPKTTFVILKVLLEDLLYLDTGESYVGEVLMKENKSFYTHGTVKELPLYFRNQLDRSVIKPSEMEKEAKKIKEFVQTLRKKL